MQKDYTKIDEEFDKQFKELSVVDNVGADGSISGYDAKPYVKEFIHTQISLSEQSLLENIENHVDSMIENGYSIQYVKDLLTSLKHLPQEEVKNK